MAKQENLEPELNPESQENNDNPYETEETPARPNRTAWLKSRGMKIAAVAVGGSLALGAAFVGGVVAGKVSGFDGRPEFNEAFDGAERPFPFAEGQRPPRDHDGDGPARGGQRDFQIDGQGSATTPEAPATVTP